MAGVLLPMMRSIHAGVLSPLYPYTGVLDTPEGL